MLGRLFLLAFVVVPLVELALLVQVGRWVGLWPTIGLVLLTGIVGGALARAQGLRTLARIQAEMAQGRMPGRALLDGAAILGGGALLLTPGVLTDVVGFALLVPFARKLLYGVLLHRITRAVSQGRIRVWSAGFPGPGGGAGPGGEWGPRETRPGEGPAEEQPYRPGQDRTVSRPDRPPEGGGGGGPPSGSGP